MYHSVSLLSYLHTGNGFRLELAALPSERHHFGKGFHAFSSRVESYGFARLLRARIVTDFDHEIIKILILQQTDDYPFSKDALWDINNKNIDLYWQQAFSSFTKNTPSLYSPMPIFLDAQVNGQNELVPFQSLFYCSHNMVYFHPPCPTCGTHLQLCQDETLLKRIGLKSYETSSERYLYCPSCSDKMDDAFFFVYRSADTHPAFVRGCSSLIKDFKHLIEKQVTGDDFPCTTCLENKICYGPEQSVTRHVIPYAFYPFHFFMFKDDTVKAVPFLALISGATEAELIKKYQDDPALDFPGENAFLSDNCAHALSLFYSDSDKHFLEVLYLKLAFLGELTQIVFTPNAPSSFASFPWALNQVRVKLTDQAGLLPAFWNFRIQLFHFGAENYFFSGLPGSPPINNLYFLANTWFYALLANNSHSFDQIQPELGLLLSEPDTHDGPVPFKTVDLENNKQFAPENIFWDPTGISVNARGRELWRKSLGLGRSLLIAGLNRETAWSSDRFRQDLDLLREEIKKELFKKSSPPIQKERDPVHQAMTDVLSTIMKRWHNGAAPQSLKPCADDADPATPDLDARKADDAKNTSGSHAFEQKQPPEINRTADTFPLTAKNEYIQETTIISPIGRRLNVNEPDEHSEYISETVIIKPASGRSPYAPGLKSDSRKTLHNNKMKEA